MGHRIRLLTTPLGLALVVVLGLSTSVTAAPTPAPGPYPGLAGYLKDRPSSSQLNAQVDRQQALLLEQLKHLESASAQGALALEAFQAAQRAADHAARVAAQEAERLAAARRAADLARTRVTAYVASLYRTGMVNRRMPIYLSLLEARDTRELLKGLGLADRVGGNQGNLLVAMEEAESAQAVAAVRASQARTAHESARERAAAAKAVADGVVAQARARVMDRQIALLRTQAAAAAALAQEQRRASLLARAELIARQRAMTPDASVDGRSVPRPHAECKGKPTSGYQNGRIPSEALCPLWGTRGQMLRADAASAFNEMSKAYAQEFGVPICVTDSYRNYEEQEAVAREKPELAARPGTSNHGWGLATDLCDGVQAFGTPAHRWMQDNSMIFGWFHPAWAQQNGSKPEAWHWEFAA